MAPKAQIRNGPRRRNAASAENHQADEFDVLAAVRGVFRAMAVCLQTTPITDKVLVLVFHDEMPISCEAFRIEDPQTAAFFTLLGECDNRHPTVEILITELDDPERARCPDLGGVIVAVRELPQPLFVTDRALLDMLALLQ